MNLVELLSKKNLKLAVAESLTAGKLSDLIAKNEGISKYYQGSITAYTCDIKNSVLGVNKEWLDEHGPYNFGTTQLMCDGVMKLMNADITVATSGVAGPNDDGDTEAGTVYISVKVNDRYEDLLIRYENHTREQVRDLAATMAYNLLEKVLIEINWK